MKLQWEKQSHQRYSASLGPCTVEVRKVGIADIDRHWEVGEVFGVHHHCVSKYPCPNKMTLDEAKEMAERVAADMIAALAKSALGHGRTSVDRLEISVRARAFLREWNCESVTDVEALLARPVWMNKRKVERELRAVVEAGLPLRGEP